MRDSIRFLRSVGLAGNLICENSSLMSIVCAKVLRAFMIRTMAASTWGHQEKDSVEATGLR